MTPIRGRVWLFGDDVNTDVIHPPQFFSLDPEKVKRGLFHGLDPTIQPRLAPGDVLVGGRDFGGGSSPETSVQALKLNGVGAILAVDFARIFFRSATNNGLVCMTFARPEDRLALSAGDRVTVWPAEARVVIDGQVELPLDPPGAFVARIWAAGGLLGLLPQPCRP